MATALPSEAMTVETIYNGAVSAQAERVRSVERETSVQRSEQAVREREARMRHEAAQAQADAGERLRRVEREKEGVDAEARRVAS